MIRRAIRWFADRTGANASLYQACTEHYEGLLHYRESARARYEEVESLSRNVARLTKELAEATANLSRAEAAQTLLQDTVARAVKGSEVDLRTLTAMAQMRSVADANRAITEAERALRELADTKNWMFVPSTANGRTGAVTVWNVNANGRDPWFYAEIALKNLFGDPEPHRWEEW